MLHDLYAFKAPLAGVAPSEHCINVERNRWSLKPFWATAIAITYSPAAFTTCFAHGLRGRGQSWRLRTSLYRLYRGCHQAVTTCAGARDLAWMQRIYTLCLLLVCFGSLFAYGFRLALSSTQRRKVRVQVDYKSTRACPRRHMHAAIVACTYGCICTCDLARRLPGTAVMN